MAGKIPKIEVKNKFNHVSGKKRRDFVEQLGKVKHKQWVNRPQTVFVATIHWRGVNAEFFARNGFPGLGANHHYYCHPNLYYDQIFAERGKAYFADFFKTKTMAGITHLVAEMHQHNLEKLRKLISDHKRPIQERLLHFSDLACNYTTPLWINVPLEAHFTERVEKEVPKYISGDIDKFVGDISVPRKKNAYTLMQDDLKNGTDLMEVQRKFGWMKSRDGFTDFYTIDELEEIRKNHTKPHKIEVKIPVELQDLARELQELTFFRTDRTDKFYEFFGLARPFLEEVAGHVGVTFKELASYDANSIMFGQPRRYERNFCYASLGDDYIISNDVLIPDFVQSSSAKIEGKVAYSGKARGIAKVVTHSTELDKVKKGDILVAQMTFPSFISAMQKAAAFVTDEGGITCHAAIIAREMKKPCVVGTRNATRVLKDGDTVEVDADKGIVRIIE